jgi:hypothetical protein
VGGWVRVLARPCMEAGCQRCRAAGSSCSVQIAGLMQIAGCVRLAVWLSGWLTGGLAGWLVHGVEAA